MATVFMKWLEISPKNYDRGIQILTLGRIQRVKQRIANTYVHTGMRVLEIGCGTGTLATMRPLTLMALTGLLIYTSLWRPLAS